MYVPLGKRVNDVTLRLSLRHIFRPRLKKKLVSISRSIFLLVGTPSAHGSELASRGAEHSLLLRMSFVNF